MRHLASKVQRVGGSLVVTIPCEVALAYDLRRGDFLSFMSDTPVFFKVVPVRDVDWHNRRELKIKEGELL